jgi:vitamin K-dependent gamma-carboxylase
MTERLRGALLAPTDVAALVAFRVMFGLLVAVSALRYLAYGWVEHFFVRPGFHFHHLGFAWVAPLGSTGMHTLVAALAAAGVLIAIGLFTRAALLFAFVALSWLQLIDVATYLNHYVLVALLALLLATTPAGWAGSVDAWRSPARRLGAFPAWCLWLLRFQVAVVYVFAGLAKVNADWLVHAQPLSIWLGARTDLAVIGPLLAHPWAPWIASWAGCLFDLTIVLWLSLPRTRAVAYLAVLVFHAVTKLLFPIGMFPAIMVVAATVFFDPSWPRRFLEVLAPIARRLTPRAELAAGLEASRAAPLPPRSPAFAASLAVFSLFAVLSIAVPLRAHLYPGDVHWHEQGMRLSWRVMVREKNASVVYRVTDPAIGRTWEVAPRRYLARWQEREFGTQPDLVLQLAHRIARDESARLGRPVEVRADAQASLNGRRRARLIDPDVDLARVEDGLDPARWIVPLPSSIPPQRLALR